MIEALKKGREAIYIPDLAADEILVLRIQNALKIPIAQFGFLRSWLALPLIARDELVGALILGHSQPDYYSAQSGSVSQAYANQVAIAIQNAQLYKQAYSVAALEERNRLARELLDSVAQGLYSISLFVDAIRMALDSNRLDTVKQHLDELVDLSREAMADMRVLIFELRPPLVEKEGLVTALQTRLDSVEARAGFQTIFQSEGKIQLTKDVEGELYRIAQDLAEAGWTLYRQKDVGTAAGTGAEERADNIVREAENTIRFLEDKEKARTGRLWLRSAAESEVAEIARRLKERLGLAVQAVDYEAPRLWTEAHKAVLAPLIAQIL